MFELDKVTEIKVHKRKFSAYFQVYQKEEYQLPENISRLSEAFGVDEIFTGHLYNSFESIIKYRDNKPYWLARDLQKLLDYSSLQSFYKVIKKAKALCLKDNKEIEEHFWLNSASKSKYLQLSQYACSH